MEGARIGSAKPSDSHIGQGKARAREEDSSPEMVNVEIQDQDEEEDGELRSQGLSENESSVDVHFLSGTS
eukprot:1582764-Lingulodinium_polyedra.AAC.1